RYEPDDPPPKTNVVPLQPAGWPVLEDAALYGLAGDVVRTLLPETEADPAALLVQFLVYTGNMIGRRPYLRWTRAQHYPVLFGGLVGRSSRSRKGTSTEDIHAVLRHADSTWLHSNTTSGICSGEGIIEAVRDARFETKVKNGTPTLVCTAEAVEDKRVVF